MPLKTIPTNISPELLYALASMGHGDELVIADGNFPAASNAKKLIRADGLNAPELLESILKLFPLDHEFCADYAVVMQVVTWPASAPAPPQPPIWSKFLQLIQTSEGKPTLCLTEIERFKFYERAKNSFAIVATSEAQLYANIIIKKGVVRSTQ